MILIEVNSLARGQILALRAYLERILSLGYPTPEIIACDTSVFLGPGPQSITGRWADGVTVLHFRCTSMGEAQRLLAQTGARSIMTDPPQGPLPEGETTRTVTAVWGALYFKIKYDEEAQA